MGPLRIAMSSYYLPSESKIGAGQQAHALAQAMARRGHDVTMFSPCTRPVDADYAHVHLPLSGVARTFRWPLRIRKIDLTSFDVYHAAGDDYLLFGRHRPAHVRTLYGSCFAEAIHIRGAKERLRMLLLGLGEAVATLAADRATCISEDTRRWFPWVHDVVPCGFDQDRFHPGSAEDRAPVPTILFVGTYERRKRGRLLMEAFARDVLPALPDAQLTMVCSDAPEAPGVIVTGRVSDEELADLYRRAWIFCLPSSYEGFGVPYAEAMGSGCPVVATPNPGAREVLADGRTGLLVEPEALGPALTNLLDDDTYRDSLARRGLERASKEYTWSVVVERYEAIYESLLRGPNRPLRRSLTTPPASPTR